MLAFAVFPHSFFEGVDCITDHAKFGIVCLDPRKFKQITTAGATTAAVTEKVWGEYVSVV